jgi:hypothetical protein
VFHARKLQDMAQPAPKPVETVSDLKPASDGPRYPWGLCLRADQEILDKLDLGVPQVGDLLHFCAVAKVTSVSQHEMQGDGGETAKNCNVELQIVELGVPADDEEEEAEERRKGWYGAGADDDAE